MRSPMFTGGTAEKFQRRSGKANDFPFWKPSQSKALKGKGKQKPRGNPMSQNLNLLRQNYCRPATFSGKRSRDLFPLEKECEDGKALLAKTPNTLLHLQEFDPYGLHQTYRDESTGAELPVFAVFELEGNHQIACEITTDSVGVTAEAKSLPAYIPFKQTQAFVTKINGRRMKAERAVTRLAAILGILPVLIYIFTHITVMAGAAVPHVLIGGWSHGTFLAYLLGLFMLNRLLPWKKLVITAEFNGILPKEAREKARAAKG